MEDNNGQFITEGTFLQMEDNNGLFIITDGDILIPRPEAEWTNDDLAIMELTPKAKYTLTCVLSKNEYKKICRQKTAKEIRDSLSINYEGTMDVRLRKVTTLTRHCESFAMKDEELVDDMFGRLQVLLKCLEALG